MRMTEEQVAAHQARVKLQRQMGALDYDRGTGAVSVKPGALVARVSGKSKFKNIRCRSHDGIDFASRLERDYYEQLLLRWKAGEVRWFTRQIPFWLEGGVKIILDFMEVTDAGVKFVDTKGFLTAAAKNKLRQLQARYGIEVELVRRER